MANYVRSESLGEMYDADRHAMTPTRRKMIHKHRKEAELYGPTLPFDFGIFKPKLGSKRRDVEVMCNKCESSMFVSKITYIVECRHCGNLIKIK